jgi:hypothetical protein
MVDRADCGQRQHGGREAAQRHLLVAAEHVVGEPVGRVEGCAVDGEEGVELGLLGGALALEKGRGEIVAILGGVAHVAAVEGGDGRAAQQVLVAAGEEGAQALRRC